MNKKHLKLFLISLTVMLLISCNNGTNNINNKTLSDTNKKTSQKLHKSNGAWTVSAVSGASNAIMELNYHGQTRFSSNNAIGWTKWCHGGQSPDEQPFRLALDPDGNFRFLNRYGEVTEVQTDQHGQLACPSFPKQIPARDGDSFSGIAFNNLGEAVIIGHDVNRQPFILVAQEEPETWNIVYRIDSTTNRSPIRPNDFLNDIVFQGVSGSRTSFMIAGKTIDGQGFFILLNGSNPSTGATDRFGADFSNPGITLQGTRSSGYVIGLTPSQSSGNSSFLLINLNDKKAQLVNSSITENIISVTSDESKFIGMGDQGSIISSRDGVNWIKISKLGNYLNNDQCVPQNIVAISNMFLSTSICSESNYITLSSEDGIIWTNTQIPRFSYMNAGANSACALESGSTRSIFCWGDNSSGQLGFGESGGVIPLPKTTTLSNLISAQLAVGESHACALTMDTDFNNAAYCWGNNSNGQLGNGTYSSSNTPHQITLNPSINSLARIYSGAAFNCLIDIKGHTWCWGSNSYGQLGMDPESHPNSSTAVPIKKFIAYTLSDRFALGNDHACAINAQNQMLYCWGNNASGQLGIGESVTYAIHPTRVKLNSADIRVARVYAGGDNTCAIAIDGAGYCWGKNSSGQVGNGRISDKVSIPSLIVSEFKYQELHPNALHTCGITSQDEGLCWGDNTYGELGDGKTSSVPKDMPYIIMGDNKWSNMTTGNGFTCATNMYDERNYCWGKNDQGTVRTNSFNPIEAIPLAINSY